MFTFGNKYYSMAYKEDDGASIIFHVELQTEVTTTAVRLERG